MDTMQSIRARIKSISSTQQITNSMRLVSSAKIHNTRSIFEKAKPFFENSVKMMQNVSSGDSRDEAGFFKREKKENAKTAILVITTDRGLCGAYNMNIARKTTELATQKKNHHIITIGSKIKPALRREGVQIAAEFLGISEHPFYEEAEMFAEQMLALYTSGEVDELYVVYAQFKNVLEQKVVAEKMLPFETKDKPLKKVLWTFEPKYSKAVGDIVSAYMGAHLYKAMTEASLCEQSARVSSMDSAAKNSKVLAEKLTLQYNQRRQAGITGELIEIIGGAEAQKTR